MADEKKQVDYEASWKELLDRLAFTGRNGSLQAQAWVTDVCDYIEGCIVYKDGK